MVVVRGFPGVPLIWIFHIFVPLYFLSPFPAFVLFFSSLGGVLAQRSLNISLHLEDLAWVAPTACNFPCCYKSSWLADP